MKLDKLTQEVLDALLDDQLMLGALIEAGVDNWEGFEYAMEIYEGYLEENE